jgi:hypothetical protein
MELLKGRKPGRQKGQKADRWGVGAGQKEKKTVDRLQQGN